MDSLFRLAAVAALAAGCVGAQDIAGDWQGTLKTPAGDLHLVVHISKAASGAWKGTIDSLDQGAKGIVISEISLKNGRFSFGVPAIQGSYSGKLKADGNTIQGTWSQGQPLPLDLARMAAKGPATPSDIDGAWVGKLNAGGVSLRTVFHIANTAAGLTATVDSPDQNAYGIAASAVTRSGASLKIEIKALGAVYEGNIYKSPASIAGTFTQGGAALPLILERVNENSLERRRPQNPVKPYPYREEDVTYKNAGADITLAGTLSIPPGKGPFPAVVLVGGSGPHDRDESLMGHKPFLVLADALSRRGIVVLRSDKRGIGRSGGDLAKATTADLAADAEAGFEFLRGRTEVDARRAGLIGHSEGGTIVAIVAGRNAHVGFIVMLAGTAVRGDEMIATQVMRIAQASGASAEMAAQAGTQEREILGMITSGKDRAEVEKKLRELDGGHTPAAQLDAHIKTSLDAMLSPWYRYMLSLDPGESLRKVKCPVLALDGEKDTQVDAKQNLGAIQAALTVAGNQSFETVEMLGLNHLFQTAKTGAPTEYGDIEETMAPAVLQKVGDFVLALPRR